MKKKHESIECGATVYGDPIVEHSDVEKVAAMLGLTVGPGAGKRSYQPVLRNGYEFWYTTYSDSMLREIHLTLVETELREAVERAQAASKNGNVKVYATYPLPFAEVVDAD